MWVNREVNIPDALVTAQHDGNLVVFAGAGISMGPPSSLPDFESLAIDIAGGGIALGQHEPLDRFLGRVQSRGTDIQARARMILDNPHSRPKDLHRELCRLFRSAHDFRLITTNFDRHLTEVLREEYHDPPTTYYAPALPLGYSFAGLVYLHGAIEQQRQQLILSDADFGRAYLTDGWATRFLYEVFRTYSVLFVGYSHRDPVISYIARSLLPGSSERFALVSSEDDGQWEYLGIRPIRYPLRRDPDPHAALGEAVSGWVQLRRMGVFDHQHHIRQLVRLPPPVEANEVDYLIAVFQDPVRLRFFVAEATGREWIDWVATGLS